MNDNNLNNSNNLKPVRCGCGGEVEVHIMGHEMTKAQYYINCEKCDTRTWFYDTEAEAITAWNKAMGAKDINVPDKERTAKVKNIQTDWHDDEYINDRLGEMYHFGDCDNCGETVTEGQKYCSYCGARLEWE